MRGPPKLANTPVDPERAALTKIRRRLLPYLLALYVIAFLDRVNIGYAGTAMEGDIPGFHTEYGFLAGIFFVGYILFEIPSNIALQKFGARRWIARIMISWGAVAMLTAACDTPSSIGIVRFTLGAMEAGFFPGIILYLTFWLPRRELARAFAVFISAQVVSMIIGAPISGLILDNISWAGIDSWRWLFILEGLPAIIFGAFTHRFLPDDPSDARWLDDREKSWITTVIAGEAAIIRSRLPDHLWAVFRQPRAILLALIDFLLVLGAFGLTFYLPSIVESFDHRMSNTETTLLVVIPLTVGCVAMFVNGWHSDRVGERPYHVALAAMIGAGGFLFLANTTSMVTSLIALAMAAIGAYGYISVFWAMPTVVVPGRAAPIGLAAINSVGSSGGFVGPYLVGLLSGDTAIAHRGGVSVSALYALAASFFVASLLLIGFMRPDEATGRNFLSNCSSDCG